jgi:hypothetical protein
MPNILINPNSGIIEFTTGTAGGSTFNTNFTGGAFVNRMSYDNFGSLNLTSYVSNITGLDRFTVDGANGRLFSVTDNLSGSLFSVNDIAGLPIIEAFDDNTVIMGAFNRNDFVLTGNSLGLGGLPNTGTTKLFISGNLNVSGMIRTPQQNKTFVYNPIPTGGGNGTGTIAYGANCTLTPRYVGTLRADACISMWGINGSSLDTVQATSFWYGTGTAPVYSGNLVNLGGTRIGGYKTLPSFSRAVSTPSDQPVGTSWVAEITGLNTGTQYWFDIGISGSNGRLRVQEVQLYIEEKY